MVSISERCYCTGAWIDQEVLRNSWLWWGFVVVVLFCFVLFFIYLVNLCGGMHNARYFEG